MTWLVGTDAITLPSAAFTASKSDAEVTSFASTLPIALECALAASFSSAPSMDAPITSALSMAFKTWFGDAPGRGVKLRSDVQSTSLIKGYAAEQSLPLSAAGVEGVVGVMGLAFTTSLNSMRAAYAFFASASFTVDIRKVGTSPLTKPLKELYTSIV